jgi:branched-chain amino acid transport system substrate-binding protein
MSMTWRRVAASAAAVAAFAAAGCGDDDAANDGSSPSAGAAEAVVCGSGSPGAATGEPITIGAIYTKQPGLDFSGIVNAARAYFACVNDSGGIGGRPIEYLAEDEQTNPQQVASLATKLVEEDKVLALAGSASVLDCSVNAEYYAKRKINAVVAGIPNDCFQSPAIAAVNSGPLLSNQGAVQYLVSQGAKSIVLSSASGPGAEAALQAGIAYARGKGLRTTTDMQKVPLTDADAVALNIVDRAGEGGGVLLAYTPPDALKILKAAEAQGVIDKVRWACPTACNDAALVKALSPAWDGKLAVNAELSLPAADDPDDTLYRDVMAKYAPKEALGSFGQMGFLAAKIVSDTIARLPGSELTQEGVNAAIKRVDDYKTGVLCTPWYFGDGAVHIPSSSTRTIVPQGGKFVEKEGCTPLEAVTPELKAVRRYEREQGIG